MEEKERSYKELIKRGVGHVEDQRKSDAHIGELAAKCAGFEAEVRELESKIKRQSLVSDEEVTRLERKVAERDQAIGTHLDVIQ